MGTTSSRSTRLRRGGSPSAFRGTCSGRYSSGSHLSLLIEYQPEGTRILGLSVPRPDVRDMGRHTPLASGAETLEIPELATSQSVVDPVHCNRTVGRLIGSRIARREPCRKKNQAA